MSIERLLYICNIILICYSLDAVQNRPVCKYGVECKMKDLNHAKRFQHWFHPNACKAQQEESDISEEEDEDYVSDQDTSMDEDEDSMDESD